MTKLTNFDDIYNGLSDERKAKIQAKVAQLEKDLPLVDDNPSQEITLNLPSNILVWLKKHRQAGQDLPTQINHLLDEAILNHATV